MSYRVHVSGRANAMVFTKLSSANNYRRVMLDAGKFAWIS